MQYRTLLFASILFCLAASAQQNLRFTHYGVDEGLPQSTVNTTIADHDGFIWIGTDGGLCRFDGYNFKVYKNNPADPNSVHSNRGHQFYVDSAGRLWVVGFDGLSLYNPIKDNFNNVLTWHNPFFISYNCIFGEDAHYIYAGLCGYGLVKINKRTFAHTVIKMPAVEDPQNNYASFSGFLCNGKIWVCRSRRLFIYDITTGGLQAAPAPETDNIVSANSTTAVGTNADYCLIYNKKTLGCQPVKILAAKGKLDIGYEYRISDSVVILCSSSNGLLFFNTRQARVTQQICTTPGPEGPKPIFARSVYKDRSGNLWIGTASNGVYKQAPVFKNFKLYRAKSGNCVNSIYAKGDTLYAGCYGTGLDIFSLTGGFVKNVPVRDGNGLLANTVNAIAPYNNGQLLMIGNGAVTSRNNLLFAYQPVSNRLNVLNNKDEYCLPGYWYKMANRQFINPYVNGSLLMGINEYLVAWGGESGAAGAKIVHYFKGEQVCCSFLHNGTLWVGTYKGAWLFAKNTWQKATLPPETEVKAMAEDNDGNMWLCTPDGIYITTGAGKVVQHFTEQNGLVNGHIYAILKDADGNMWFTHTKGLTVYRDAKKTFEHFTAADGLQADEFNRGAYYQAPGGELFFGGVNGTTGFYPGEILYNPYAPATKITSIKLLDEPYKSDTSYWATNAISLPYSSNSISFEFTGLEFTDPAKNQFAYTMAGLDTHWINAGGGRFARYAGLQPGSYTFMVKAANNDGVWGQPTSIAVYIAPPYWQRTWFLTLAGLALAGCVTMLGIGIQKIRQRKMLRELKLQQGLQRERERISRELHDNVGTQLSLISKNIEVMAQQESLYASENSAKLHSVNQLSKDVIATLRETIWALHKDAIPLDEFSDKLKVFAKRSLEHATGIALHYNEELTGKMLVLHPAEAIHLFRICQEAIVNAVKYAGASVINITLVSSSPSKYQISIRDNGIGFDLAQPKKNSYGIENMHYRAAEIGCTFNLDSQQGKGTCITIAKN